MSVNEALDMGRNAFLVATMTAAPILMIGMVVGLVISLVQSVTQLQEQTLTFVPKMLAMIVAASYFIPWITRQMLDYTQSMLAAPPGW